MARTLLRSAAVLSVAGVLLAATRVTALAGLDPAPLTPVAETAIQPQPPDPEAAHWLTVPITVTPAAKDSTPGHDRWNATATSLSVAPLGLCVSCARSRTRGGDSRSDATVLSLLGLQLAGGSSTGRGSRHGALVMVPANPLLTLAIGSWMAETRADGSARSRTSLVDVGVGPTGHGRRAGTGHDQGENAVTMSVIESDTGSTPGGSSSATGGTGAQPAGRKETDHGTAQTNAVDAGTGDQALAVALAHSDSSDDGQGKAYVAGVNKGELVGAGNPGDGIPVQVPGVTKVVMVQKTVSDGTVGTAIAQADAPAADSATATAVPTAQVSSTTAAASSTAAAAAASTPATGAAAVTATAPPPSGAEGIPSTGTAMSAAGAGVALVLLGFGIMVCSGGRRGRVRG